LLLEGENNGVDNGALRDARSLVITKGQFQSFLDRHKEQKCLVPEDNDAMKNSYLNLDEEMRSVRNFDPGLRKHGFEIMYRFLNCSLGGKTPGRSILEVGVPQALQDAGFDNKVQPLTVQSIHRTDNLVIKRRLSNEEVFSTGLERRWFRLHLLSGRELTTMIFLALLPVQIYEYEVEQSHFMKAKWTGFTA
jgi:hypothetical protein